MKFFEPNENRTTIAVYVFLVALFGVLCVILGINIGVIPRLLGFIGDVLRPVLYGFIFAFALHPIVEFMENTAFSGWKRPGTALKHTISIITVYVTVLLLITLFCISVIPEFINNYDTFATQLTDFAENFQNRITESINRFPGGESIYVYYDIIPETRTTVSENLFSFTLGDANGMILKTKPNTVQTQVREAFQGIISAVTGRFSLSGIFTSAMAVVNSAKNLIIGIIISIYFLAGEKNLLEKVSKISRAWLPLPVYHRLMWMTQKVKDIFRNYIMVRLLDGVIVGFLTFFVLFLFRVPYVLLLSVIIGVASFFPFIGPVIGIASGSFIVLIVDVKYLPIFIIVTVLFNILDSRYVEPLLNSGDKSNRMSAVWVFAAIVVMGGLFGILGVVFGIPVVAFIYSMVKEMSEKKLRHERLPVETSAYFVGRTPKRNVAYSGKAADIPPDMETYFAERREEETEASRNIRANVSGKFETVKRFFSRLGKILAVVGRFFRKIGGTLVVFGGHIATLMRIVWGFICKAVRALHLNRLVAAVVRLLSRKNKKK